MALINCPECGKEISDTSDVCIHCGYKLKPAPSKSQSRISKRTIIIILVSVILIILGVFTTITISQNISEQQKIEESQAIEQQRIEEERKKLEAAKLTYKEKVAYYAIEGLKTILKNPESLQVHSLKITKTISAIRKNAEGYYDNTVVIIEYSAQNGLGGSNRDNYFLEMKRFEPDSLGFELAPLMNYDKEEIESVDVKRVIYAFEHPEALE